ncbi:MAG: TlpA family protein disulfide reductase [Atopobiaceae bacterium]|nr:TlpA family protein disulfide reductase [Atopobiaceae bacterium]
MNTTRKRMIGVLVGFVVVMVVAVVAYGRLSLSVSPSSPSQTETSSSSTSQTKTIPAPDFSFTDEGGSTLNFASFQDKPTVLVFWASWCPYCKAELDGIQEIYAEFADKVNFVALDCIGSNGETEEAGRATKEEHGWEFPIYFDSDVEGQASYGVRSMPATAIVDTDGNISVTQLGLLNHETLASLLRGMGA